MVMENLYGLVNKYNISKEDSNDLLLQIVLHDDDLTQWYMFNMEYNIEVHENFDKVQPIKVRFTYYANEPEYITNEKTRNEMVEYYFTQYKSSYYLESVVLDIHPKRLDKKYEEIMKEMFKSDEDLKKGVYVYVNKHKLNSTEFGL